MTHTPCLRYTVYNGNDKGRLKSPRHLDLERNVEYIEDPLEDSADIRPLRYQIKVLGRLDEHWSAWFGEMAIAVERKGDGTPITTLTGEVADQVALRGILSRLLDLNLTLISVAQVAPHCD